MDILYFFEKIRFPILDQFFLFVTKFGEETVFMVTALIIYWCVNKHFGYYILSMGFLGTVVNQFLKIFFRIPRPWVLDNNFKAVNKAIPQATGYSFPSGHTQNSVTTFGGIALFTKNKWIKVISITLVILVPLSRMYLGVHTPLDVATSLIISTILIFTFYPIIKKSETNHKYMWWIIGIMFIISIGFLCFVTIYKFPNNVNAENLSHATENAYKLLGAIIGMALIFFIDNKYTNFKTEAPLIGQLLKVSLGLIAILTVKEGLKILFAKIGIDSLIITETLRYFLMVVMAGAVWPLTFPYFSKIKKIK